MALFEAQIDRCNANIGNIKFSRWLEDITTLKPDQKLAIHLRHHNIGVVCEKKSDGIQMSFYPGMLDNEDVLKQSHIRVTYPSKTILVPESDIFQKWDSVKNPTQRYTRNFANIVMCSKKAMDIACQHSNKGNTSHQEIRKNRDPTAFLQLLFDRITFRTIDTPTIDTPTIDTPTIETPTITKHLHDEIRWDNSQGCFRRSGLLAFMKAVLKHSTDEMTYKQYIIDVLLEAKSNLNGTKLQWANMKITRKIQKFKQQFHSPLYDTVLTTLSPVNIVKLVKPDKPTEPTLSNMPEKHTIKQLQFSQPTMQDCQVDINISPTIEPLHISKNSRYPSYTDLNLEVYQQLQTYIKDNATNANATNATITNATNVDMDPDSLMNEFNSLINNAMEIRNKTDFKLLNVYFL